MIAAIFVYCSSGPLASVAFVYLITIFVFIIIFYHLKKVMKSHKFGLVETVQLDPHHDCFWIIIF